jgi:Domain of unknown function (DUF4326)
MTTTVINIKSGAKFDIHIGRNMMWTKYKLPQSKWYNPYLAHKYNKDGSIKKMRDGTVEEVVAMFWGYILLPEQKYLIDSLHELKDKILGCWCKGDYPACGLDHLQDKILSNDVDSSNNNKKCNSLKRGYLFTKYISNITNPIFDY